jgi:hypothetical protein
VPLVLGCFLLAFVLVAGGVAAGDAFVQQSDLQSTCDAAAIAGADAASLPDARVGGDSSPAALPLGDVQLAVASYLSRDSEQASVSALATVDPDGRSVEVDCQVHETLTFGAVFGLGSGVLHRASSTAQAPLR